MKFNTTGDQLVIYARDFVEVIQLQVKKETQVSCSQVLTVKDCSLWPILVAWIFKTTLRQE